MTAMTQAMAPAGVSISAQCCRRIFFALDLKPWQVESWMTSPRPRPLGGDRRCV
jgi:hypothetical protein